DVPLDADAQERGQEVLVAEPELADETLVGDLVVREGRHHRPRGAEAEAGREAGTEDVAALLLVPLAPLAPRRRRWWWWRWRRRLRALRRLLPPRRRPALLPGRLRLRLRGRARRLRRDAAPAERHVDDDAEHELREGPDRPLGVHDLKEVDRGVEDQQLRAELEAGARALRVVEEVGRPGARPPPAHAARAHAGAEIEDARLRHPPGRHGPDQGRRRQP